MADVRYSAGAIASRPRRAGPSDEGGVSSHSQWGYSAPSFSGSSVGFDVFSFDPATSKWRLVLAPTDIDVGVRDAYWTGSKVLLPAYGRPTVGFGGGPPTGLEGRAYDPVRNRYTDVLHGPVDDTLGPTLWTGHALVRFSGGLAGGAQPGDGAVWDPGSNRWAPLPRAPFFVDPASPSTVWTGREVLMWGHLYRPAVPNQPPMPSGLGLRFGT